MNQMRRWMRLCESEDDVPALPGRVQRLLDRPIPFTLKDGRPAIMQIEGIPNFGLSVMVEVDGQFAGSLSIAPNTIPPAEDDLDLYKQDRGSWSVVNVLVRPEFRRQGIGK